MRTMWEINADIVSDIYGNAANPSMNAIGLLVNCLNFIVLCAVLRAKTWKRIKSSSFLCGWCATAPARDFCQDVFCTNFIQFFVKNYLLTFSQK